MTPSAVSVVVPCYNAARWVGETVASAVAEVPPQAVLVVDDGSTDGSGDLIAGRFPQVRLVRTPNRGVSSARNLGIELSAGEFLVFLDADDVLAPGSVARHLAVAETTGADVVYGDWQRLRAGPDGTWAPAEVIARTLAGPPELELSGGFWCPTGAYLYRRAIVERVGGFSPRLPVIQDARFAQDCALRGGRFAHAPGVACLYRVHDAGSVSTRSRVAFLRDILTSAREVRDYWAANGGLTPARERAVFAAFDQVAGGAVDLDPGLFADACREAAALRPRPVSDAGRLTGVFTRLLGYRVGHRVTARVRAAVKSRPR